MTSWPQKVQGQHLNWYIVEQLPMIRPEQFEGKLGKRKIADFVRDEVLRLSYTAWDLHPFVREQDEKAHGRFLTRDLVLAYLNAVEAGDLKTTVSV